ncbi:MAG: ATP-binding protein [Acidimicrobiia bacterium]
MTDTDVQLVLPADAAFLRLARLTAADIGTRLGLGVEDVDDLRIAVDELCFAVVEHSPGPLVMRFRLAERWVEIEGECPDSDGPFEQSRLARTIVAAVVDDHRLERRDGSRCFWLRKRVPEPSSG